MTDMKIKLILLSGLLVGMLSSCSKMLDPYPNGDRSSDEIYQYPAMVQGLVGQCYDNMPRNYNDNEGAYLDGATDDAVITSSTNTMSRLATGTLSSSLDPFLTFWDRDYKSIYLVNKFLIGRKGINTRLLVNPRLDNILRRRLQGEAFALRAWFEWDLLQKFGGKATNGELLGFPIILEPLTATVTQDLARNTYDECVQQIISDCDSAYKYLPLANRDFLVPVVTDRTYLGGINWGRFDGITTRAIKANVYLAWASPRFNPNNVIARWDSAASNARKVMNFKLMVDNVTNGFNPVTQISYFAPNSPEIVISSRYGSANEDIERMFYPGGFQGNGVLGATQELVDAFPTASGYPINDPGNRGGYNATNPYAGRDPRLYSAIFYNNLTIKKGNTGAAMYTFENWANGGKDAAGRVSNNTLTNYYIKKFVYMSLNWSDPTISRTTHSKFFIRWAHMCLNFAEAANHVVGPTDVARYGMSAKTALQYLRARKTTDGTTGLSPFIPLAADPYLTEVANAGATAFDALVKNERRIETCFEGIRFFDLRRWSTDLTDLNKSVHGAGITKNADGTFTYDLKNFVVQKRSFTSAYLPIPYTEMLKVTKFIQNEGWDSWN